MKKIIFELTLFIFILAPVFAAQTVEYPSAVAHDGAVAGSSNLTPAQARVVWNIENLGHVSLWFSGSAYSGSPSDAGPFGLTGDTATNDSIYLHYSVLGNISADLFIRAAGPMTSDAGGSIDWGIYRYDDRNVCLSGMDSYEEGSLSDNVKGTDYIRLYVSTVDITDDPGVTLVPGRNEYSSSMEVRVEIV